MNAFTTTPIAVPPACQHPMRSQHRTLFTLGVKGDFRAMHRRSYPVTTEA
jgi:hypothetical protein